MKSSLPKGTRDILPVDIHLWQHAERVFAQICASFGYQEIRTPVFEHTEVFQRGVGDTTDIVQKEMYTFDDKGGRSLTLRPEGTAGVVRSYVEQGMGSLPSPVRLFYNITAFRYENVQKGRYREFHQFGIEALGAEGPEIDAEIISLLALFFEKIGLEKTHLCINSIGCPDCRARYNDLLKEYYRPQLPKMCRDCSGRFEKNPLRILDCKEDFCHSLAADAPKLLDHLCPDCQAHFDGLRGNLDELNLAYTVDSGIVRGLDYYTRTVFEFVSDNVGTQGTICGGGRYDGLVENLGGQKTPGIGFAMGVERLLMELMAQNGEIPAPPITALYIASMDEASRSAAAKLALDLRRRGVSCQVDLMHRSLKAQLKYAGKTNVPYLMVLGADEVASGAARLKRMSDGSETEVVFTDRDMLASLLV